MISIDKLETNTEKLIEKVKALSFQFKDPQLSQEAETAKEEAIASLEAFLTSPILIGNSGAKRASKKTIDKLSRAS
jgi:hypothetical protein